MDIIFHFLFMAAILDFKMAAVRLYASDWKCDGNPMFQPQDCLTSHWRNVLLHTCLYYNAITCIYIIFRSCISPLTNCQLNTISLVIVSLVIHLIDWLILCLDPFPCLWIEASITTLACAEWSTNHVGVLASAFPRIAWSSTITRALDHFQYVIWSKRHIVRNGCGSQRCGTVGSGPSVCQRIHVWRIEL